AGAGLLPVRRGRDRTEPFRSPPGGRPGAGDRPHRATATIVRARIGPAAGSVALAAALAAALVAAIVTAMPRRAFATAPGANGPIAFDSTRGGSEDVWVASPDGSGAVRLTGAGGADLHPSWSPDGSHLVFQSTRSGGGDLYVVSAGGAGMRRLTRDPAFDGDPAWSPDGS